MKSSIFSVSILAAVAAFALLVFSFSVPGGPTRPEKFSQSSGTEFSEMRIEELEQRASRLKERLGESERRLAQWENNYHKGEVPQYFLKRMNRLGYHVKGRRGNPWVPGSASNLERERAGVKRAGTSTSRESSMRPATAGRTDKSHDKNPEDDAGTKEKDETAKKERRYVGGLLGLYYQGRGFDELKLVMTDYEVDFDFANGSPDRLIIEDKYSIRWVGYLKIDREAKYTFRTLSDDGVRLWIGGRPVINNWGDHAATYNSGTIRLKKGYHPLRLDFYENGGVAAIKLYWSSDRFSMEIIPPANLYHDPAREDKARKELR